MTYNAMCVARSAVNCHDVPWHACRRVGSDLHVYSAMLMWRQPTGFMPCSRPHMPCSRPHMPCSCHAPGPICHAHAMLQASYAMLQAPYAMLMLCSRLYFHASGPSMEATCMHGVLPDSMMTAGRAGFGRPYECCMGPSKATGLCIRGSGCMHRHLGIAAVLFVLMHLCPICRSAVLTLRPVTLRQCHLASQFFGTRLGAVLWGWVDEVLGLMGWQVRGFDGCVGRYGGMMAVVV